ncbi:ubiquitin-like domain-containing protein [Streptantibioticus ferralitis]|uniref:Ubiquitin-like domain-containing protein n=1 Tax=Streptantibioticus ferralitis TaxID=236510 RepID=A0ABT5Z9A8_9ACTN|nr:resuscitation-promoting factor [Streptantibioticus ferralitis]MDF2260293.1 ubiquitin-like domain-containing protein [Streptantibioticus ferralitis]
MSSSQGSHRGGRGTRVAPRPAPPFADSAGGTATAVLPRQSAHQAAPPPPYPPPYEGTRAAARQSRKAASGRTVRQGTRKAGRGRRAVRPDPLRQLLPRALVVAFLAGGTSAYLSGEKDVELTVDGTPRTLHTFAGDVPELLRRQHIPVGDHDIVAPAPDAGLHDGDDVAVRYGRPIALTLDGQPHRVWTTARTVDEALRQLGVRAEGAHLSASRDAAIGRAGLRLDVRTERTVTFLADGREHTVRTNAATVRQAASEAGIVFGAQDTTSVDPGSYPRDGQTVSVMRITGSTQVREEPIPFHTVRQPDPTQFKGTEVVVIPGEVGVRQVTYEQRTVNGVKGRPRRTAARVLKEPIDEVIAVGTRARPGSVAGADGLNWSGLARCEAGGRPNAVDPSGTYGGLYQFDTRTWHALGGTGRPQDAPAAEQTYRAKKLYVRRGASPWPVCGRKLMS